MTIETGGSARPEQRPAGELSPGDVVAGYEIIEEIGSGGMGVVYLARDTASGTLCALKEMRADMAHRADVAERFHTEAKVLATLRHPSIVALYGAGTERGRPYIAMEYVKGRTLRDILRARRAPLPLPEVLHIAAQVGSALCAAHRCGVVHRDLKPENVLVQRGGRVKVVDVGLAKLRDGAATTDRLQALATPLYAAPEQLARQRVDGRTDVYSLALMIVEMATGRYAFADHGETMPSDAVAVELHHRAQPNQLSEEVPGCPRTLSALVERALSKERERRPDAATFVAALLEESAALGYPMEEEEGDVPRTRAPVLEAAVSPPPLAPPPRETLPASAAPRSVDPLARFARPISQGPRGTTRMVSASVLLAARAPVSTQPIGPPGAASDVHGRFASLPPPPESGRRLIESAPAPARPPAPVVPAPADVTRPSMTARPSLLAMQALYAYVKARPARAKRLVALVAAVILGCVLALMVGVVGVTLWASSHWRPAESAKEVGR